MKGSKNPVGFALIQRNILIPTISGNVKSPSRAKTLSLGFGDRERAKFNNPCGVCGDFEENIIMADMHNSQGNPMELTDCLVPGFL